MEVETIITKFDYKGEKTIELEIYGWDEYICQIIRTRGVFYEDEALSYLRANFSCQKTILDVGANIGNHTTFFAEFMNAEKIHAFEPHPMNFELLQRNTSKYSNVVLHNCAIGETTKQMSIETALNNMGSVRVLPAGGNDKVGMFPVEMFPLDAFNFSEVTLIKLDVEGFEYNVLRGAAETIRRWKPTLVIEALHVEELYSIVKFLTNDFGYIITDVVPDLNLVYVHTGQKNAKV